MILRVREQSLRSKTMPAEKKKEKKIKTNKTQSGAKKKSTSRVAHTSPKTQTARSTRKNVPAKTKKKIKVTLSKKSAKTVTPSKKKVKKSAPLNKSVKKVSTTKKIVKKSSAHAGKPAGKKVSIQKKVNRTKISKQKSTGKTKKAINNKLTRVVPSKAKTKKHVIAKKTLATTLRTKVRPKTNPASHLTAHKKKLAVPVFPTAKWGTESVIHFEATTQMPPAALTSIAGGVVFYGDRFVLANVPGRGWEIIGGRIDLGEDPEETFRREAHSQLGVSLSHVRMLGLLRIEHKGPKPPNCPYPYPVAYGVQYIGIALDLEPFGGGPDSLGRSLITLQGLKEHYYNWNPYFEAVFNYAYEQYQKWRKKMNA